MYQSLGTSHPHRAGLVRLLYLALGHAARLTGLSLPAAYHMARLALGAAALPFFGLGSGLGWLQLALGWNLRPDLSPIDFWLIDAYGFFSLLVFPHFAAVIALTAIGFDRLAAYFSSGRVATSFSSPPPGSACSWSSPLLHGCSTWRRQASLFYPA